MSDDQYQHTISREQLGKARRIVIKIGTQTISDPRGSGIDKDYIHELSRQCEALHSQGRQILIVSSGAIGMGAHSLGLQQRSQDMAMKQACASIGQPLLMQTYRDAFSQRGMAVAQILVTRDQFNRRDSFNNLKRSVEKLLQLGVIPVINENDSISTEEIGRAFGDNDQLSAYVASKIDAELLIILSDIDGLYDANPRENPDARKLSYIPRLENHHREAAGGRGSGFSTGGMRTKLKAVDIARDAGCRVVLAQGREEDAVTRICAGENLGSLFESAVPMKQRRRWIKHAEASGRIVVDNGALEAMREHRSLLPRGIISVEGVFQRGDVVLVNDRIKLVTAFDSGELEKIIGRHSAEIPGILGQGHPDVIARPEDMVILEERLLP
ncbi:glutamate 5-kinase [Salinispira pacifica]|uniref:Glutamate 5-kinase n=1 Tax=Salinispira pacifica TaxID=1307761 RepID=V5WE91_9SPIO|nr:glutamate 5-kinase [Salinispira pacifica]AHC13889.1 Glutamate 5-kinase [Salinispira pacifica]